MAVIGDILVKLVADFAEFTTGMDAVNKKLDEQGDKLKQHGSVLEGIAKQLTGLGTSTSVDQFIGKLEGLETTLGTVAKVGAALAIVVGAVALAVSKGKEIEDYALAIDKLKTNYGLTTAQAQGMESMMRSTGRTAEDLNRSLSAQQKTFLGDYYKSMFGDSTAQIEKVTTASNKLSDAWHDLGEQAKQSLVQTFGDITAQALDGLTTAVIGFTGAIRDAANAAKAMKPPEDVPAAMVTALGGSEFGVTGADVAAAIEAQQNAQKASVKGLAEQYEDYRKKLADAQKEADQGLDRGGAIAADIENFKKKIADLSAEMLRLAGAGAAVSATLGGAFGGLVSSGGGLQQSPVPGFQGAGTNLLKPQEWPGQATIERWLSEIAKPTTTSTGGGGKTDDDSIDAQIKRFQALEAAAKKTGQTLSDYHATNIEDFTREIRVQEQVEQVAAKLGAKYSEADATRKQALHDQIDLADRAKEANQIQLEGVTKAVEIERKYGDGTAQAAKSRLDLDRAEKANIATKGALASATKAQQEADEQARLEGQRYKDTISNIADGFEHAANAYQRSNDYFSMGEQAFTGLVSAMTEGLDILAGTSTKTFGQVAADFAKMLADMALKAAIYAGVSYILRSLMGGGVPTPNLVPTPAGSITSAPLPDLPHQASGGYVMPGGSYTVGENGPERFVPNTAGMIVPSASSGGGNVTVNLDMTGGGNSAATPKQAADFARKVKQAVVDTINNEKRPGGTLYAGAR